MEKPDREYAKLMRRAMRLAARGTGLVNPNPLVGALLVIDGKIIGEGYHGYFGGPHAEVIAMANAVEPVEGATLFVTLEPCSHQGKTPPCAPLIAEKGIAKVIIGMTDPNPLVAGKGIKYLTDHGVEVITGVLEDRIRKQNEIFIKFISESRPFTILKTAMTLDGKIATVAGTSKWISGEQSRKMVHTIRREVSAVMVGINTVLADDPMLNVRLGGKQVRQPLKIIVDSSARIFPDAKVMTNDPQLTMVAVTSRADKSKLRDIERSGVQIIVCPEKDGRVDLQFLMEALGKMEIDSVLIEGGSTLAWSALTEKIVDKVISFISPKIIGGEAAPSPVGGAGIADLADAISIRDLSIKRSGEDFMLTGYINK